MTKTKKRKRRKNQNQTSFYLFIYPVKENIFFNSQNVLTYSILLWQTYLMLYIYVYYTYVVHNKLSTLRPHV